MEEIWDECIESLCRLCAESLPISNLQPLYKNCEEEDITKKINTLISNFVDPLDGLPQEICDTCKLNVENSYEVIANMIKARDRLKYLVTTELVEELEQNVIIPEGSIVQGNNNDKIELDETSLMMTAMELEQVTEEIEDEGYFYCDHCRHYFSSTKSLEGHACHVRWRGFCFLCNCAFKSKVVYESHMTACHVPQEEDSRCIFCDEVVKGDKCRDQHLQHEHPDLAFLKDMVALATPAYVQIQCELCGRFVEDAAEHATYHEMTRLKEVQAAKSREKSAWFQCKQCKRRILSKVHFLFHMAKHEGKGFITCEDCGADVHSPREYNMHAVQHKGMVHFQCSECDKLFMTRSAMSDHALSHMDGERYACNSCSKRFKTSRQRAQHKRQHHMHKYVRCRNCSRGFTSRSKCVEHEMYCEQDMAAKALDVLVAGIDIDEAGEGNMCAFYCDICRANVRGSSELSILFHKARHEGKKGVECLQCGYVCTRISIYRNHMLIHADEKPYKCEQCGKAFRNKASLLQHTIIHSSIFPYKCQYCGKQSKKLTTHTNHVNIHLDVKPYTCPDCCRPFRQLSDMKKHRKTHSNVRNKVEKKKSSEMLKGGDLIMVMEEGAKEDNVRVTLNAIAYNNDFVIVV